MVILVAEWLGCAFSWLCKWCKASKGKRARKIGFILSCILNVYWGFYFCCEGQYGLVVNAFVNMSILVRGIKNNS